MHDQSCGAYDDQTARAAYALYLKPRLARLLKTFRLDVSFHRAEGDTLFYEREGRETAVVDMVGGFGACLLGHNHPDICDALHEVLSHRRPILVQASIRNRAAQLAERLSEQVGRLTGRSYVVTFANSGAEAIESAIKHALLARGRRSIELLASVRDDSSRYRRGLASGTLRLAADFLDQAARSMHRSFVDPEEVLATIERDASAAASAPPLFLAAERGFHGKSTGAVQLTHRAEYRLPWSGSGIATAFIDPTCRDSLDAEVAAARRVVARLAFGVDGRVGIRLETRSRIAALFCEPVQGEGGIHELSDAMLQAFRAAADTDRFALVVDEIQCGLGRCGTFLASAAADLRGDYYVLSKALGGGVAKIAALLVDSDLTEPDFDLLHTSTFADDDISCTVALRALDIIERDGIARRCAERGAALRDMLERLRARFPQQVLAVRGRGLMAGIELASQSQSSSPMLRVLSDQGLLAYLASGYLFNNHQLRVAPTLGNRSVLRLEPSAYFGNREMTALKDGLTALLEDLRAGAIEHLIRFMVSDAPAPVDVPRPASNGSVAVATSFDEASVRVGFIVHFTSVGDLKAWEPGLAHLSDRECSALLDLTHGLLEPFVLQQSRVKSTSGPDALLIIIGAPFTPEQAIANLRSGCEGCGQLVAKAVEKARLMGCAVVGLGGYTSIVTDDARDLAEDRVVLTTGNSLTVAAAHAALLRTAVRKGLDLPSSRLGIVGATGNVGATMAELAMDRVGAVHLVGRAGGRRHLEAVAARLLGQQLRRVRGGEMTPLMRHALELSASLRRAVHGGAGDGYDGTGSLDERQLWRNFSADAGEHAPLSIQEGLDSLKDCNIIVSATNAPRAIIEARHVATGPTVICDIAVPHDVDPGVVALRPETELIRGGIVHTNSGEQIDFPPLKLVEGEMYGCLAEALVLGLSGYRTHYSQGPLSVDRVRQIAALAGQHGFEV